jgi:MoxR-like ATPase
VGASNALPEDPALAAAGRQTLAERPETAEVGPLAVWRLKLEGIVREIDAGFVPESLPTDLAAVRTQIAHILSPV